MPPEERDTALLWDMLAARAVVHFVEGRSLEQYRTDDLLRSAVERKIEIIGEAARGVSRAFQHEHKEIAWYPITAQRHVLAHDYGEIDDERVWRVATIHVPELIALLEPLLPAKPPPDA